MKINHVVSAIAMCMSVPGVVFAQSADNLPIDQFVVCPNNFQCDDRSNPVSPEPEKIRHTFSGATNTRMIYRVGLKPQTLLVSEIRKEYTYEAREVKPTMVLVQPVDVGLPWQYVPPKK